MRKSAVSGLLEIKGAWLARERSGSATVRGLALRLLDDHTESRAELSGIARTLHVALPNRLDRKSQSELDDLRFTPAASFDEKYLHDEVRDHRKAVSDAENEIVTGTNDIVAGWARSEVSTLDQHLNLALQAITALTSPDAVHTPDARPHTVSLAEPTARAPTTGSSGLPAWGYALIGVGGLAVLLAVGRWLYRRA